MWGSLEKRLRRRSTRLIREHEAYAKHVFDENQRRKRRSTGQPQLLSVYTPHEWKEDDGHNPYIGRSRASSISHSVGVKLRQRVYQPRQPAGILIPKTANEFRTVATFQIVDEVISHQLLESLSKKNSPRLSSRAYAYSANVSAHDAIAYIASEFGREHRLFVAEYDFAKYFDTVSHEFLLESLNRLGIVRTPLEQYLIERFLRSPLPAIGGKEGISSNTPRTFGLPQGTSISLFLANVAAAELDRKLERLGVGFTRYADDTLLWSTDYGRISAAVDLLHESAEQIGSSIQTLKSPGVHILVKSDANDAEMATKRSVEYLGHTITLRNIRMKPASVAKIKKKIGYLLYSNLLQEPLSNTQSPLRLTDIDRDYVTYIWQLRRYLYGPLSENQIRRFQAGSILPMSFQGVMSFFPLVNDDKQLSELDGWLALQTVMVMRKRRRLIIEAGLVVPPPLGLGSSDLIGYRAKSGNSGTEIDLRLPSFRRIASTIRAAVEHHGLRVASGGSFLYAYG
jgi:hypothetical protein